MTEKEFTEIKSEKHIYIMYSEIENDSNLSIYVGMSTNDLWIRINRTFRKFGMSFYLKEGDGYRKEPMLLEELFTMVKDMDAGTEKGKIITISDHTNKIHIIKQRLDADDFDNMWKVSDVEEQNHD